MSTPHRVLAAVLLSLSSVSLSAQDAPLPAPKVLQIGQEVVKPGKAGLHEASEMRWPAAFAKAGLPVTYTALSSMTGNAEVLYVSGYASYAAYAAEQGSIDKAPGLRAQLDKAWETDGDFLTSSRGLMAEHQEALSIGTPPDWAAVRGYRISLVRVRIGHTEDYEKARKLQKESWVKSGQDPHILVYRVTQGVNVPTYMIFRPFVSVADFDGYADVNTKLMASATPDGRAEVSKLLESSVLTNETNTYTIAPRQSLPSARTAAADPAFWKANPAVAMRERKAQVMQAGTPKKP